MRYIDTLRKMKEIHLKGLDDLDVADAMYFNIYEISGNRKDVLTSLARCIVYLVSIDVDWEINESGEIAILYSNSYKNREDYKQVVESLGDLFDSKIMLRPGKNKLCLRNIRFLPNLISWFHSYLEYFPKQESIYYSSMLLFAIVNVSYIERVIDEKHCRALVVLSDMHMIDSLLVQKCNNKEIPTITMQHGNFELDEPFVLSKSKYFLTHGEYSKSKAISYGMDDAKLLIVGIPKLISHDAPDIISPNSKKIETIGVVMSGVEYAEEDSRLLNIAIQYCQLHNKKLYVKFHPNYGKEYYPKVNWEKIDCTYTNEINIDDYKNIVDIALIHNSTVFIEYALALFPTLIYVDGDDCFVPHVRWCKFDSVEGLKNLIECYEKDTKDFEQKMINLRKYFSPIDGVALRYKNEILKIAGK